jgi:hypothetical protein
MSHPGFRLAAFLLVLVFWAFPYAANAQLMIIGNDEKVTYDDNGAVAFSPPGKDTISIVDISNREAPKILVSLPLMNSIYGPPVNLAITPDERLAIVANSLNWVQEGTAWKPTPDNRLYVIDLKASPPKHIATVEVGKQPSGLSINARGDLALVANREDKSISVLSIQNQLGGDGLSGKLKLKVEPLPTSLSTQIFPPCSSTNFLASVNPSPVPSTLCA